VPPSGARDAGTRDAVLAGALAAAGSTAVETAFAATNCAPLPPPPQPRTVGKPSVHLKSHGVFDVKTRAIHRRSFVRVTVGKRSRTTLRARVRARRRPGQVLARLARGRVLLGETRHRTVYVKVHGRRVIAIRSRARRHGVVLRVDAARNRVSLKVDGRRKRARARIARGWTSATSTAGRAGRTRCARSP
jgi:hypothetical protein